MPVRRKVFRIEEMCLAPPSRTRSLARAPASAPIEPQTARNDDGHGLDGLRQLKDDTDSIFRAINRTKQEIAALHVSTLTGAEDGRVRRELGAVVDGAEDAIQRILAAAEEIDEAANTLTAVLKNEQHQALAHDIRDQIVRIFEACNFHDLAGQRIAKVLATWGFVEERVNRMMEIWGGIDAFRDHAAAALRDREPQAPLINGPKLNGDAGHASQADIDALFESK
jgi:chemotaxis protein CheZ